MMRAKMQVETVTLTTYSEEINLTIANKELHGKIKPGQKFYVDFTPVD